MIGDLLLFVAYAAIGFLALMLLVFPVVMMLSMWLGASWHALTEAFHLWKGTVAVIYECKECHDKTDDPAAHLGERHPTKSPSPWWTDFRLLGGWTRKKGPRERPNVGIEQGALPFDA